MRTEELSVIEVARILNTSQQTVYSLCKKGKIKKVGNAISWKSLERYLLARLREIHGQLEACGWDGENVD